jgi:hypothetical protein
MTVSIMNQFLSHFAIDSIGNRIKRLAWGDFIGQWSFSLRYWLIFVNCDFLWESGSWVRVLWGVELNFEVMDWKFEVMYVWICNEDLKSWYLDDFEVRIDFGPNLHHLKYNQKIRSSSHQQMRFQSPKIHTTFTHGSEWVRKRKKEVFSFFSASKTLTSKHKRIFILHFIENFGLQVEEKKYKIYKSAFFLFLLRICSSQRMSFFFEKKVSTSCL